MRLGARVAMLVVLWLLAWGELSLPNLLSGTTVAAALLVAFPPARRRHASARVRPAGVWRLALYVGSQLLVSNVVMGRYILSVRPKVRPGVIAHRLTQPSEEAITIMTSIIALSPGTMTVDVDRASTTIYVHFFRLVDPVSARASLERLDRLIAGVLIPSTGSRHGPAAKEAR